MDTTAATPSFAALTLSPETLKSLGEMGYAARLAQADAIVLSGSIEHEAGLLAHELPRLVRTEGVPVFVGGRTSVRGRDAIVAAGAEPLGGDIGAGLRRLGEVLQPAAR